MHRNNVLRLGMLAAVIGTTLATAPVWAVNAGAPGARPGPLSVPRGAENTSTQRFIVKFKAGSAASRQRSSGDGVLAAALARSLPQRAAPAVLHGGRSTATGATLVRASRALSKIEADALVVALRQDPQVAYAQIDLELHALADLPDDPKLLPLQWDMLANNGGIGAPNAWSTTTGEGVLVAVLDTGVLQHDDLAANLVPGYDMVSENTQDGDGRDPDATDPGSNADGSCSNFSSWHGTHVAGTVAAVGNNGKGIAGAAWRAQVQPVRVLGACGSGAMSDIADGVIWAAGGHVDGVPDNLRPAEVINMSLGGDFPCSETPELQAAIDMAVARGVTVVVAAGNSSIDVAGATPAGCRNVITVAASNAHGGWASSYTSFGNGVTVSAPGGEYDASIPETSGLVWSTGDSGTTTAQHDNVLVGYVGTSMAAPHVAGIVALMQSAAVAAGRPALTPAEVATVLRASARPFTSEPRRPVGNGIADAGRAVALAMGETLPEPPPTVLRNGVTLAGQQGQQETSQLYTLEVPAGTARLNLRTMGGTGIVSLYASVGSSPSADDAQFRSTVASTAQAIVINRPQAGTWYLRLVGTQGYRGVSILGLAR